MSSIRPFALIGVLAAACQSSTPKAEAPSPAAPSAAAPSNTPPATAPVNPHAPGASGPHAQGPSDPHGPLAKPDAAPLGPPTDVTPSGALVDHELPGLVLSVPKEWTQRPPANQMRVAEFRLPGPGGEAELLVFRFPGGGGSVKANVDRWLSQFRQADGSDSASKAVTKTVTHEDWKSTLVDLTGIWKGGGMPGTAPSPEKPDHRLLAAVVEGQGDPYYLRTIGPSATLALWATAFEKMLSALRSSKGEPNEGEKPAKPEESAKSAKPENSAKPEKPTQPSP